MNALVVTCCLVVGLSLPGIASADNTPEGESQLQRAMDLFRAVNDRSREDWKTPYRELQKLANGNHELVEELAPLVRDGQSMAISILDFTGAAGVSLAPEVIAAIAPNLLSGRCAPNDIRSVLPKMSESLAADPNCREVLVRLSKDPNPYVSEWAIAIVLHSGQTHRSLAVESLPVWFDARYPSGASYFRTLGYLADAELGVAAAPAAQLASQHLRSGFRELGAEGTLLEQIGETSLPFVAKAFESQWPDTRRHAANWVGHCPKLAAPLQPQIELCLDDEDPKVRLAAAFAWWKLTHDTDRIESVLADRLLGDPYHAIQLVESIEGELEFLIPTYRKLLTKRLGDHQRTRVMHLLWNVGPRRVEAVPELREMLHGNDAGDAAAACGMLARLGHDNPAESAQVLGEWLPKLRRRKTDRYLVLGVLKNYGDQAEPIIPQLAEELNHGFASKAADVLAAIGEPALPVLEAGLTSDDWKVCKASQQAIDQIRATQALAGTH